MGFGQLAKRTTLRIAVLQNLPSPNRLPIFDRLLDDPDLDVMIFFTGKPGHNRPSFARSYRVGDERVRHLSGIGIPFKGRSGDSVNINLGMRSILEWRPDVILLYSWQDPTNMVMALLARLRGIPYIVCGEISFVWNKSGLARLFAPLVRWILRSAAILVAGSESCAKFYESQGIDARRISVVPAFAQFTEISSAARLHAENARTLRKRLHLDSRFVVLYVGRLVPYKGIGELLSAMNEVWRSREDVTLLVVGTGPMENLVASQSRASPDKVLHLGSVDYPTLIQLYSISDIHVLPSWHEAYGLVCGEALASGTPTIATRTSGCSDLVIDGVNGILIEPMNPHLLAQTILRLAGNRQLVQELKRNAQSSVSNYTVDKVSALLKQAILRARTSKSDGRP